MPIIGRARELSLIFRVSHLILLQDSFHKSGGSGSYVKNSQEVPKDEEMVRMEDLLCALKETRPSVNQEELKKYQKM